MALLAWAALIFILSVIPAAPPSIPFAYFDKLAHAAFYAPLGTLVLWTFPQGSKLGRWARAAAAVFIFGLALEFIQAVLPWRSFELLDAAADLVGGGLGAALAIAFPRINSTAVADHQEPAHGESPGRNTSSGPTRAPEFRDEPGSSMTR